MLPIAFLISGLGCSPGELGPTVWSLLLNSPQKPIGSSIVINRFFTHKNESSTYFYIVHSGMSGVKPLYFLIMTRDLPKHLPYQGLQLHSARSCILRSYQNFFPSDIIYSICHLKNECQKILAHYWNSSLINSLSSSSSHGMTRVFPRVMPFRFAGCH